MIAHSSSLINLKGVAGSAKNGTQGEGGDDCWMHYQIETKAFYGVYMYYYSALSSSSSGKNGIN